MLLKSVFWKIYDYSLTVAIFRQRFLSFFDKWTLSISCKGWTIYWEGSKSLWSAYERTMYLWYELCIAGESLSDMTPGESPWTICCLLLYYLLLVHIMLSITSACLFMGVLHVTWKASSTQKPTKRHMTSSLCKWTQISSMTNLAIFPNTQSFFDFRHLFWSLFLAG